MRESEWPANTMSFDSLLNTTCIIESKTETQGDKGSVVVAWATKVSGVKTRKRKNGTPKIFDSLLKTYVDDYIFYMPVGTNIAVKDRVNHAGALYEVLQVATDSEVHHMEIVAKITHK